MITLEQGRKLYDSLTSSEREVVNLLADGHPTREICAHRRTEETTVRSQIKAALAKFDLHSQIQLIAIIWGLRQETLRAHHILAKERLEMAKKALVTTGYFKAEEVSDDIAPRITEMYSALSEKKKSS